MLVNVTAMLVYFLQTKIQKIFGNNSYLIFFLLKMKFF
jgi:hypothetical protein